MAVFVRSHLLPHFRPLDCLNRCLVASEIDNGIFLKKCGQERVKLATSRIFSRFYSSSDQSDNQDAKARVKMSRIITRPVFPVKNKFAFNISDMSEVTEDQAKTSYTRNDNRFRHGTKNDEQVHKTRKKLDHFDTYDNSDNRFQRHDVRNSEYMYKKRPHSEHLKANVWHRNDSNVSYDTSEHHQHSEQWSRLPGLGKRQKPGQLSRKQSFPKDGNKEVLFGLSPILMSLKYRKRQIYKLYTKDDRGREKTGPAKEIYDEANKCGIPIESVSVRELDALSNNRPHQGMCMVVGKLGYLDYNVPDGWNGSSLSTEQNPTIWLVLDKIQDPMNFGAILRSAYFLGIDRIFTVSKESCALSPVVSKASAGSLEVMDIYGLHDLPSFLKFFHSNDWHIIGTGTAVRGSEKDTTEYLNINEFNVNKNTILILGNEGHGLTDEVKGLCTHILSIPTSRKLLPGFDSLNVSVAAGILLHSLIRSSNSS